MPERTCAGCRGRAAKGALVRVVLRAGEYVVDLRQREPGRGAYLHPGCEDKALKNRGLQRALRAPVPPPAGWTDAFRAGTRPASA